MSIWNKQDWIKDILSKSGTEITEIKDEENKDIRKMVYYTALPLMMQSEQSATQICTNNIKHEDELQIGTANISNNYLDNQLYSDVHSSRQPHHQTVQMHQIQQAPPQHQSTTSLVASTVSASPPTKPQFKCDQCNMLFGSKSAHTSHIKSHAKMVVQQTSSNVGPVPSVSPGGSSSSSSTATTTNLSSSDPYQCDVCKKTFAVPARLVRHYRTHTGERPFECEFCHKMFSVKENLQVHRRIHTKERPYKCEVCGRAFEHSGKLHRHMRIHTGERPHKCSVCGKTFIQSGQLVIHMRTHTGEKPYKCPVEGCGKGFTCSKQLKVHSRTHTGEKPYHCDICFRDFGYNHVLKLHRVQHYGSKCYKCTICDETFKSKKEMEAHIKGHANEIPDEEEDGTDSNISSYTNGDIDQPTPLIHKMEIEDSPAVISSPATQPPKAGDLLPETPRESSSEATSDGDEHAYYTNYPRYDRAMVANYTSNSSGVNLLADVSMIASASDLEDLRLRGSIPIRQHSSPPPPTHDHQSQSSSVPLHHHHHLQQQHHLHQQQQSPQHPTEALIQSSYAYEPLAVMRHQGYFAPVPKVEEFRPAIGAASDMVKRVEAAIAGVEPMLTPPRSSPESPERSSSPESDTTLMANRDNMSLPLRKRKLYLKDDQNEESPVMRLSSVIQFAKAS